eukprot:1139681-Pelagomonas_calceolata.AAC.2
MSLPPWLLVLQGSCFRGRASGVVLQGLCFRGCASGVVLQGSCFRGLYSKSICILINAGRCMQAAVTNAFEIMCCIVCSSAYPHYALHVLTQAVEKAGMAGTRYEKWVIMGVHRWWVG